MKFRKTGPGKFVIRLEKGDDILGSLRKFADTNRIGAAFLEGIGSLNTAKLGHYDFETKNYKFEVFHEDLEILSLSGNIATMNKKALPHAHVTLGKRDFTVIGGHLDDGSLANMVEIGLTTIPGKLLKAHDAEVGLNLLQLKQRL
jgi:uncharacterized protein